MKVVKWLLAGTAAVIAIIFGISLFLPESYAVDRTVMIEAPVSVVREAVVDLENWREWEPWGRTDESMRIELGAITRGEDATYSWTGERTGTGEVRIIAAEPLEVRYQYVFNGDETHPAFSEMILEPLAPEHTQVTWTFRGKIGGNPLNRYIGLLVGPMVGVSYENGLKALKAFCES